MFLQISMDRFKRYRARLKDRGLIKVAVQIPHGTKPILMEFVRELRRNYRVDMQAPPQFQHRINFLERENQDLKQQIDKLTKG